MTARGPHNTHPIRQTQPGGFEYTCELAIPLRAHHKLGIHSGHEVGAAFVDETLDSFESRTHVKAVDPDTEDSGFRQASCRK